MKHTLLSASVIAALALGASGAMAQGITVKLGWVNIDRSILTQPSLTVIPCAMAPEAPKASAAMTDAERSVCFMGFAPSN